MFLGLFVRVRAQVHLFRTKFHAVVCYYFGSRLRSDVDTESRYGLLFSLILLCMRAGNILPISRVLAEQAIGDQSQHGRHA